MAVSAGNRAGEGHAVGWPHALQIKEKFGGLHVYLSARTPAMHEAIDAAAARANRTCDQCGAPGILRNLGGYRCTRCDFHANRGLSP